MKKVKWIILTTIGIIIIFVGSIFFYIFVGENEDTQTTKKEVEEVTNVIIDEIDSKLNEEIPDSNQEENIDSNKPTVETVSKAPEKKIEGGIADKQGKDIDNKEKQILEIYDSAFHDLQISANSIVDDLVSGIKSDYNILKAQNEDSVDKLMKLGASYTKRANALEKQVDSSVSSVLDKMEKDMEAQGISQDKIKAYRKSYEEEYSRQKEARRNAIMSKAQEMM